MAIGKRAHLVLVLALSLLPVTQVARAEETGLIDAARCRLAPTHEAFRFLTEGPTDPEGVVPSTGTVTGLLLLVDFSDAPATRSPASTYELLGPDAIDYYDSTSFGKLDLRLDVTQKWYRMPKASTDYAAMGNDQFINYARDAVTAADPDVDFRKYDMVHYVFSEGSAFKGGGAFLYPAEYAPLSGDEWTPIQFGSFLSDDPLHRWRGLMHEMAHDFGLPDLYSFAAEPIPDEKDYLDWRQHYVGAWDPMSNSRSERQFLAWHSWKLGWYDDNQIACVGSGSTDVQLSPVETGLGTKAAVIPVSDTKAYVAEVRRQLGQDSEICEEGVLIYEVISDTSVVFPNGSGPVRIKPAQPSDVSGKRNTCGDLYGAPYSLDAGEVAAFEDAAAGVKFELLSDDGVNYTIRATDTGTYVPAKLKTFAGRTVSMKLSGAKITTIVASSEASCVPGSAVSLQKKTSTGWKSLKTVTSDAAGTAAFRVVKPGKYRASVAGSTVSTRDTDLTCGSAVSNIVRKRA